MWLCWKGTAFNAFKSSIHLLEAGILNVPSPSKESNSKNKFKLSVIITQENTNMFRAHILEVSIGCNVFDSVATEGDINELGSAKKFVKAMLGVPFAFQRVEAMLYKETFEDEVFHLRNSFSMLWRCMLVLRLKVGASSRC